MTVDSPVLSELSTSAREALLAVAQSRRFAAGTVIVEEGEKLESIFVVKAGQVKMSRLTPQGKNLILTLFGPGEMFGIPSALGGDRCLSSLSAAVDTECLAVPRTDLFGLLSRRADLVPEVLGLLTRRLAECRDCLVETACSRVETRFAHLFLQLCEKLGEESVNGHRFIPLPLSRQDLADMTGTTIETTIRLMSRWGKNGVVTTLSDGFRIEDPEALLMLTWQ